MSNSISFNSQLSSIQNALSASSAASAAHIAVAAAAVQSLAANNKECFKPKSMRNLLARQIIPPTPLKANLEKILSTVKLPMEDHEEHNQIIIEYPRTYLEADFTFSNLETNVRELLELCKNLKRESQFPAFESELGSSLNKEEQPNAILAKADALKASLSEHEDRIEIDKAAAFDLLTKAGWIELQIKRKNPIYLAGMETCQRFIQKYKKEADQILMAMTDRSQKIETDVINLYALATTVRKKVLECISKTEAAEKRDSKAYVADIKALDKTLTAYHKDTSDISVDASFIMQALKNLYPSKGVEEIHTSLQERWRKSRDLVATSSALSNEVDSILTLPISEAEKIIKLKEQEKIQKKLTNDCEHISRQCSNLLSQFRKEIQQEYHKLQDNIKRHFTIANASLSKTCEYFTETNKILFKNKKDLIDNNPTTPLSATNSPGIKRRESLEKAMTRSRTSLSEKRGIEDSFKPLIDKQHQALQQAHKLYSSMSATDFKSKCANFHVLREKFGQIEKIMADVKPNELVEQARAAYEKLQKRTLTNASASSAAATAARISITSTLPTHNEEASQKKSVEASAAKVTTAAQSASSPIVVTTTIIDANPALETQRPGRLSITESNLDPVVNVPIVVSSEKLNSNVEQIGLSAANISRLFKPLQERIDKLEKPLTEANELSHQILEQSSLVIKFAENVAPLIASDAYPLQIRRECAELQAKLFALQENQKKLKVIFDEADEINSSLSSTMKRMELAFDPNDVIHEIILQLADDSAKRVLTIESMMQSASKIFNEQFAILEPAIGKVLEKARKTSTVCTKIETEQKRINQLGYVFQTIESDLNGGKKIIQLCIDSEDRVATIFKKCTNLFSLEQIQKILSYNLDIRNKMAQWQKAFDEIVAKKPIALSLSGKSPSEVIEDCRKVHDKAYVEFIKIQNSNEEQIKLRKQQVADIAKGYKLIFDNLNQQLKQCFEEAQKALNDIKLAFETADQIRKKQDDEQPEHAEAYKRFTQIAKAGHATAGMMYDKLLKDYKRVKTQLVESFEEARGLKEYMAKLESNLAAYVDNQQNLDEVITEFEITKALSLLTLFQKEVGVLKEKLGHVTKGAKIATDALEKYKYDITPVTIVELPQK